jgi:hypothetical protein
MKTIGRVTIFALASSAAALAQVPLTTAFSYQGQLKQSGAPAGGTYDLRFRLYDAASGGILLGTDCVDGVMPENGLFTTEIDFGLAVFDGNARWLEVAVRVDATAANCAGGAAYTVLTGRQPLTAVPYALFALDGPGSPGFWTANGTNIFNANSGLVGIGTTTPGSAKLDVVASPGLWGIEVTGDGQNSAIRASSSGGTAPTIYGTSSSTTAGAVAMHGLVTAASPGAGTAGVRGTISSTTSDDTYGVYGRHAGAGYGVFGESISTTTGAGVYGNGRYGVFGVANSTNSIGGVFGGGGSFGSGLSLWATGDGLVSGSLRVGTASGLFTTPIAKLQVDNGTDSAPASGGFVVIGDPAGANLSIDNNELMARSNGAVSTFFINHNGGDVNIGQASGGTTVLRAPVVEITGGADLSENFDVTAIDGGTVEPGMIVCIDTARPGKLLASSRAYDRTVAGIISGAGGVKPGMRMGQDGTIADGAHPVALSGRVYVFCDASSAPIAPGDLLTTSDTAGHAMKVSDYPRAQGAIIGKAMTSLAVGEKGLVLVLVNLQ